MSAVARRAKAEGIIRRFDVQSRQDLGQWIDSIKPVVSGLSDLILRSRPSPAGRRPASRRMAAGTVIARRHPSQGDAKHRPETHRFPCCGNWRRLDCFGAGAPRNDRKELAQPTTVIPHESGGSSTPRFIHVIARSNPPRVLIRVAGCHSRAIIEASKRRSRLCRRVR